MLIANRLKLLNKTGGKYMQSQNVIHNSITRDGNSEIWELSKLQRNTMNVVIITKIIVFDTIGRVYYYSATKFKRLNNSTTIQYGRPPNASSGNFYTDLFHLDTPKIDDLRPFKCQGHLVSLWQVKFKIILLS